MEFFLFRKWEFVKDNRVLDAAESGLITKNCQSFDYDSSINCTIIFKV
jgi:hypothetical protein